MSLRNAALGVAPAALAAAVLAAGVAPAQQNPRPYGEAPNVTINASPNPVVFSTPVVLTGRVRGARNGVLVTLQGRPVRSAGFATLATSRTARNGSYRLTHRPATNEQYRVLAATAPATQSPALLVRVRMLVGLRVSDATPRRGSLVRFAGIVRPPHTGRRVAIQKRAPSGRFVTVARTRLRRLDAGSSRYARRVRVRRSGVYRVLVTGHDDHASGISRTRTLVVH
jgi:hypothetical protein